MTTEGEESGASRGRASPSPDRAAALRVVWQNTAAHLAAAFRATPLAAWADSAVAALRAHLPPERRRRRWVLPGVVLLVVIVLIVLTQPGGRAVPSHPSPGTTVFHVDRRPLLNFVHSAGQVHVSPGPDGQVTITESRNGITSAITTNYQQKGDAITTTVAIEDGLPLDTWVDFDVRVPRATGVTLAVAAGTLEADGLNGPITLQDTNGSIWVTHVSGTLALQTQSGSINTDGVTGEVRALTQNGTITTSATALSGRSLLQAASGTINFHGTLDPTCAAVFRDTNGAIGVALPRGASARVSARTPQGSIDSAFPSIKVVPAAGGQAARGTVGKPPWGQLSIQTTNGSIGLSQELP